MSKRLQVILDDEEIEEIKTLAHREHMSVSTWVRAALRRARLQQPGRGADLKIQAIRSAARFSFPSADIDRMLAEIEVGYGSDLS